MGCSVNNTTAGKQVSIISLQLFRQINLRNYLILIMRMDGTYMEMHIRYLLISITWTIGKNDKLQTDMSISCMKINMKKRSCREP